MNYFRALQSVQEHRSDLRSRIRLFSRKLLRSSWTVFAIVVVMLGAALFTQLRLQIQSLSLANDHAPAVEISALALSGLERSAAALHAWVALADPAFKADRLMAWNEQINPAIDVLKEKSRVGSDSVAIDRLTELIDLLEGLEKAQLRVENLAHTPGNQQARKILIEKMEPIADDIAIGIEEMVNLEKDKSNIIDQRNLVWQLADTKDAFLQSERTLNDLTKFDDEAKERKFRSFVELAKQNIQNIQERRAELTIQQRGMLESIQSRFAAYEALADQVITVQQSDGWNAADNLMITEVIPRVNGAREILAGLFLDETQNMRTEAAYFKTNGHISIVVFFGLLLAIVLAAWLQYKRRAKRIAQPISQLVRATRLLGSRHLNDAVSETDGSELNALVRSFNAMRISIQKREAILEDRNMNLLTSLRDLERQVADRKLSGDKPCQGDEGLDARAKDQTTEFALAEANKALQAEIAGRKRVEEKLFTLSSAIEQSPNATIITDPSGRIEYVNPKFTELTGYASEEVIGKTPRILQSDNTPPEAHQYVWASIMAGTDWRGEIKDKKKNGELYWANESISSIKNSDGTITHFLMLQEDITEQKRVEKSLRESEERFRQVAAMTGEWLWEQDPSGHYMYSSTAVKDILGYEPAEIVGKHFFQLLTPAQAKRMAEEFRTIADIKDRFFHLINRYKHKDGREVITESTGEPILDKKGDLIKWRGVDRDITAQKDFEDALRLRDRAIEAASVGIVISDATQPNYPTIYVNPAFIEMTGYSRDELIGRDLRILHGSDTDPTAIEEIHQALRDERRCELVLKNYRKDGESFWNEVLLSPVHDDKGKMTNSICVHTDVTELRQAEEERHEMEIAKEIQQSLLPRQPLNLSGLLVAGYCLPTLHIGGDYFDYFCVQDCVDVVIADVSGHSVGAALIMAETRSTLKAETRNVLKSKVHSAYGASDILHDINDLLYEDLSRAELFITMFYMKYSVPSQRLIYANAGHTCPLLLRKGENQCTQLDAEGLVLGVNRQVTFEEKSIQLEKGDTLLLYTDGITEATNKFGECFGTTKLCQLFAAQANNSPQGLIDGVIKALETFCETKSFDDDISMVVMKIM